MITPFWTPDRGLSFSAFSRWVTCRERGRLYFVEGLREDEGFIAPIEFGSLWHEAEEAAAEGKDWMSFVLTYRNRLRQNYPTAWEEIDKWTTLVKLVFPLYRDHWKGHKFMKGMIPVLGEKMFKVPYTLPSGRIILFRGKMDFLWSKSFRRKIVLWLQENKTKGSIDEGGILGTLGMNLQTMLYLIVAQGLIRGEGELEGYHRDGLDFWKQPTTGDYKRTPRRKPDISIPRDAKIGGSLYNVVRRPLSDRKSPRQRKKETTGDFLQRVANKIQESPDTNFFRWEAHLYPSDFKTFKDKIFHPLLEDFLDWWTWMEADGFEDPWRSIYYGSLQEIKDYNRPPASGIPGGGIHSQAPWGVYNSLAAGWRGDYFDLLTKGSRLGLMKMERR